MPLTVVIAPSGFKECLDAEVVAEHLAAGVRRADPEAEIRTAPLVDGGEGTTRTLVAATAGELHDLEVSGPVGTPVRSHLGFLGTAGPGGTGDPDAGPVVLPRDAEVAARPATAEPRTAVVEMAAAAGLALVPRHLRDPLLTTTRGVGELVSAALDRGARRILVGCGDSGTSDGGAGLVQALGGRLLDADGLELGPGGRELARLDRIDLSGLDARLADVEIDVACNVHNQLCGPNGVARVFGPQKGASPEDVELLSAALEHWADALYRATGDDVRDLAGGGASGGLGAALHAVLGARLRPRFEVVMQYLDLDGALEGADLVLTAEGGIDVQTPRGKVPAEVARRAQEQGVPTIALAGTVGDGAEANYAAGIDAYGSILDAPRDLAEAIADAPRLLSAAAEQTVRTVLVGRAIVAT